MVVIRTPAQRPECLRTETGRCERKSHAREKKKGVLQMRFIWKATLCQFMKDESGLSAVEYGLLAAGIAIGLYAIVSGIGTSLRGIYTSVGGDLSQAAQ